MICWSGLLWPKGMNNIAAVDERMRAQFGYHNTYFCRGYKKPLGSLLTAIKAKVMAQVTSIPV